MTIRYEVLPGQELTEEQKQQIAEAAKKTIEFDDDCPELSPAMMKSLEAAVRNRNRAGMLKKA